jgi:AcrR family transcriptional regulator
MAGVSATTKSASTKNRSAKSPSAKSPSAKNPTKAGSRTGAKSGSKSGSKSSARAESQLDDPTTREHILQIALEAFSIHGFDGASTRAIASEAGVNQGLIPYYFGTKQTLWREAVDRAFEELHAAMGELALISLADGRLEDRTAIARMIRGYVAFVATHPEFVRLMNEEGKRKGPRMRWLVDRHVRPLMGGLTKVFEQISEGTSALATIDPIHLNYIFVGAVATIFHQAPECRRVADYDPMEASAVEAHADALVQLFLGDASLGRESAEGGQMHVS